MSGYAWQRRWDPFRDFQREVGRLIQSLEPLQTRVTRQYPALNLHDAGDRYVLTVPIPGMRPEDIDLSITGETLTLRGERKRPEGVSDEAYRRQERPFGRWIRTVTLPDRVDSGQVAASYTHGVLTVTIPKAESARPRQITVSGG
ncbi:MAG: Hsp20/alpha crystallin family protein [Isosphaeraceae bacterium]